MPHYKVFQKNRMKYMIVNAKIAKIESNFGSDQKSSSSFHSLLCHCIYSMRNYPIYLTWAHGKTPNILYITWESK